MIAALTTLTYETDCQFSPGTSTCRERYIYVHTCIYTLAAYMYMYTEFYRKIVIYTLFMQKFVDDERFLYIDTALSVDPVVSEHLQK